METVILAVSLFVTAAAYASVGLGGGTAYLALLSFWNTDPHLLRPLAWELNILCSLIVFYNYYNRGYFVWRITWPYLLSGIIGSVLGASLSIDATLFRWLLALTLTLISVRMLTQKDRVQTTNEAISPLPPLLGSLALGGVVGFISGLIGIGGGIILGPILIGLGWVTVKRTAAITSAYILLCSFSALLTHGVKMGLFIPHGSVVLGGVVVIGGFLGSYYGSGKASPSVLRKIFAAIVFIAALNLLVGLLTA